MRRFWLPAGLLTAVTFLIFLPVILRGGFLWDDFDLIVHNDLIHSPHGLWDIWFTTKNFDYFPLTSTTFWIEWRLWGAWPEPYHALNVLLHLGSALLIWRILEGLRIPGAFLAALLFAIHPVNVESVAWISERKNTLSMFFMCVSLLAYLRYDQRREWTFYAIALAAFLLALLAKTAVVMLPFVLSLLAWYQRGRLQRRDFLAAAPFFLLSFLLGVVTVFFQYHRSISDIVVRTDSLPWRAATAGCAVWFYLAEVILPIGITFNYPRWNVTAFGAVAFVPLIALIVVLILLGVSRRRAARNTLISLLCYLCLLFPMLGFLNIFYMRYSLVSDHYQYHAIAAVLAVLAAAVVRYLRRVPQSVAPVPAGAVAFVCVLLAMESASIAMVYRSAESVWLDTLAHNPRSWLAHAQLGAAYLEQARSDPQKLQSAIEHLRKVTELQPQLADGYVNLGNAYALAGRAQEAAAIYEKGLAAPVTTKLDLARLHQGLGSLAAKANHYAEAEEDFRQAVQEDPESVSIHYALGTTYMLEGKTAEARAELSRALQLDPTNAGVRAMLQRLGPPAMATSP